MAEDDDQDVRITYTNYRDETAIRKIRPVRIWFGSTEWHTTPQWLLDGYDYSRDEFRSFALSDVAQWRSDTHNREEQP